MKYQKKRIVLFLGIVTIIGMLFRFYFASLNFSDIRHDMSTYVNLSDEFLQGKIVADCCTKQAGYPLFLAFIFRLFGANNFWVIRVIQSLLDVGTGVLIAMTAKQLWSVRVAIIVYILYLINPFTTAFVGLILPESLTFFLLSVLAYITTKKLFPTRWYLWLLLGLFLGLLLFIRTQFIVISILTIIAISILTISSKLRFGFLLISICGFLIGSSYTMYANYTIYKKVSLVVPYTMQPALLYLMFYQIGPYPEVEFKGIHPKYSEVMADFGSTPLEKMPEFQKKYYDLLLTKLSTDWPQFIYSWGRNAFWMWDKEHLSTYLDPFYPGDRWIVRFFNIILGVFAAMGLYVYKKINKNTWYKNPIVIFTFLLFINITFIYTLVSNESRHSLVFYPFIILWAGYGLHTEVTDFLKFKNKNIEKSES